MIQSGATVCLIPELSGGPFLYSGELDDCCRRAAEAGFDAVELLMRAADAIDRGTLRRTLAAHRLKLSGLSTGGGFLVHRLQLCSPDAEMRRAARSFAESIIDLAGEFGGFSIVGVLKGTVAPGDDRDAAKSRLRGELAALGERAGRHGTSVMVEMLNRYESNWFNRLDEGVELLRSVASPHVRLLADLFHMNIEEADIAGALRDAAGFVGHVHLADSNRRAPGAGHLDFAAVGAALGQIGYDGYVTAEILPWPDPAEAARRTLEVFRRDIRATGAAKSAT